MSLEKEMEVYNYVKENAIDYLPVILNAIVAGVVEENQMLREKKSKVEGGLVVLGDKVKLERIDTQYKSVLLDALQSCTFFKMDSFIAELQDNITKKGK